MPGLKIDGRRVQGSLNISRALDAAAGRAAVCFPADPEQRRAVEEAEAWGEGELQPVPRRMFRWGASRRQSMRVWMVRDMGMPAPNVMARVQKPLAHAFARMADVSDERVRADIAALPAQLDHIDRLIADGVIGGDEPNAADFQIGDHRARVPRLRGPPLAGRGTAGRRPRDAPAAPVSGADPAVPARQSGSPRR